MDILVALCRTETMTGQTMFIDSGAIFFDAPTTAIHAIEIKPSDFDP